MTKHRGAGVGRAALAIWAAWTFVSAPKSLQAANSELNTRYEESLKVPGANPVALQYAQRTWISERDETCGAQELPGVTQAGLLAYVLADQNRALCVLNYTRERAAELAVKPL